MLLAPALWGRPCSAGPASWLRRSRSQRSGQPLRRRQRRHRRPRRLLPRPLAAAARRAADVAARRPRRRGRGRARSRPARAGRRQRRLQPRHRRRRRRPAALAGDMPDRVEALRPADARERRRHGPSCSGRSRSSSPWRCGRPRRAVLDAFLVGLAVSLLVNDTPGDVLGAGAAIAVALAHHTPEHGWLSSRPMRRAALLLALLALAVGLAGCGGEEEASPTPETIVGTLPEATTSEEPASTVEGDPENGAQVFASAGCGGCHTMEAAGSSGSVRAEPRPVEARPGARGRPRHERAGRDALVRRPAERAGNRRRGRVRRRVHFLNLPDTLPRTVAAVACDLDRTLIGEDGILPSRTIAALGAPARLASTSCSRPAACSAPSSPTPRRSASRRHSSAIRARPSSTRSAASGSSTSRSRSSSPARRSPRSTRRASRSTATWTTSSTSPRSPRMRAPTRTSRASRYAPSATCSRGSSGRRRSSSSSTPRTASTPAAAPGSALQRAPLHRQVAPLFPRARQPGDLEGQRLCVRGRASGLRRGADGRLRRRRERLELIEWAGCGIAVGNAHAALRERADWVCPDAADEGVAQVLEALLDLRT